MFVRIKTSPNSPKKAIQIVESVRKGDKVSQRIVRHVGTAFDKKEEEALKDLAEHIKAKIEHENQPGLFPPEDLAKMAIEARKVKENKNALEVDLKRLRHQETLITGIHDVYGKIYNELGYHTIFTSRHHASRKNLFHIVMARIANPSSKRNSVLDLSENFATNLSLSSVYRMMDELDENRINKINTLAFKAANSLFKDEINITFYDCTTLYFESFTEDELKENGYSKDNKFNQPQILLALLSTREGLPIGYDVFPGSRFEGHTLEIAIDKIKKQYKINRIVFVADSAMLSDDNQKYMEDKDIEYIVGARIKSMSDEITSQITDLSSYKQVENKDLYQKIKKIELNNNRKLLATHSLKRSEKDRYDREEAVRKLQKKINKSKNPASLISNYGYKKFLKLKGKASVEIDTEKMKNSAKWDGLHGIITNINDMSNDEILKHYHSLWEIEECFRVSKHDLKIRPIFHWTPKRIRAHIAICFIALVCVRYLQYRSRMQYKSLSAQKIRQHLLSVRIEILKHLDTNQLYGIPTRISQEIKKIYAFMHIPISDVPFQIN